MTEPILKTFHRIGAELFNTGVCQLVEGEPLEICCCTCIYLKPVHFHCETLPKPTLEQMKEQGVTGRCVCGVQKGWACTGTDVIHDNWPRHSGGCELHTTKP